MDHLLLMQIAVFVSAGLLSALLTPAVRAWAVRRKITDSPNAPRKMHGIPVPLLGGIAIVAAFFAVVAIVSEISGLFPGKIPLRALGGFFVGSVILMIGGYLDDRYRLKPGKQIWWAIAAAAVAVGSGIAPSEITNPFGGVLDIRYSILDVGDWGLTVGHAFAFLWLMGMMYTTKLLDGLDGLSTGITGIGALMIFGLTMTARFFQPDVGFLALALAGACAGFLIWNFHPAKIFLGEGGSLWVGYALGVLAIISGSKVATTLLVVGAPAVDVGLVLVRRIREKRAPWSADAGHLHYRLLAAGLSHRGAVCALWALAGGFGILTLFLQSIGKLIAVAILIALTVLIAQVMFKVSKEKT